MEEQPTADGDPEDPGEGFVRIRGALVGLVLLWLAAISAFGALQAGVYAATTEPVYAVITVGAATLSVTAGYGSLRAFGYR